MLLKAHVPSFVNIFMDYQYQILVDVIVFLLVKSFMKHYNNVKDV